MNFRETLIGEKETRADAAIIDGQPSLAECMILPGFFVGRIVPNQVDAPRARPRSKI